MGVQTEPCVFNIIPAGKQAKTFRFLRIHFHESIFYFIFLFPFRIFPSRVTQASLIHCPTAQY